MPNITKRTNKDGSFSYKITVTKGRDANGKQIRHFMTFTPAPNMTEKKAEKEAQRVAFAFEKQIEDGFSLDNRQTFSNYAEYVIDLKERAGAKHRTIERYRQLMERINPAIGHIKLTDLKPQHLNAFYKNLAEEGIRKGADRAQTKVDLPALLKKKGLHAHGWPLWLGCTYDRYHGCTGQKNYPRAGADDLKRSGVSGKRAIFHQEEHRAAFQQNDHRTSPAYLNDTGASRKRNAGFVQRRV